MSLNVDKDVMVQNSINNVGYIVESYKCINIYSEIILQCENTYSIYSKRGLYEMLTC